MKVLIAMMMVVLACGVVSADTELSGTYPAWDAFRGVRQSFGGHAGRQGESFCRRNHIRKLVTLQPYEENVLVQGSRFRKNKR